LADIFVSYSSEDQDRVKPIVEQLQSAGYSVWWDSLLRGGPMIFKEIGDKLEKSKVVLAVWTSSSVLARWVADEVKLALSKNKLVPIRLDDVEAPIEFRTAQTIDFSMWCGQESDPAMQTLFEAITHRIESETSLSSQTETDFKEESSPSERRREVTERRQGDRRARLRRTAPGR